MTTTKLQKYESYKPSSVEWLGEIPSSWEVKRLNYIADSFPSNVDKYFYRHKPLRAIEEVSADILKLEELSDGLIREILGL